LVDVVGLIIDLVVAGIIGGIFVWLAAKALKAPKATYWHGILTVISAIIVTDIIRYLLGSGIIAAIIEIIVILVLIKHFFGVGWLKAIVIAILAWIILIIVIFVLSLLGIFALKAMFPELPTLI